MSARTLQRSRIALIPSQGVRAVFDADQRFARAIVSELAHCYRSVVKAQKNLKLRSPLERLANYLQQLQKQSGSAKEFDPRFEKRRLASMLGMTPENQAGPSRPCAPMAWPSTATTSGSLTLRISSVSRNRIPSSTTLRLEALPCAPPRDAMQQSWFGGLHAKACRNPMACRIRRVRHGSLTVPPQTGFAAPVVPGADVGNPERTRAAR